MAGARRISWSAVEPDLPSADDVVCTAFGNDRPDATHFLFAPPCTCPRCAPDPLAELGDPDRHRWLRIPGHPQRLRVEAVELGQHGRSALG